MELVVSLNQLALLRQEQRHVVRSSLAGQTFARNAQSLSIRPPSHIAKAAAIDLEALESESVANVTASPSGASFMNLSFFC